MFSTRPIDKEEDIQRLQMQRFDREEIACKHLLSIQKRPPRTPTALGRGQEPMTAQDVLDGRWINDVAEFRQLALDLVVPHGSYLPHSGSIRYRTRSSQVNSGI